MSEITPMDVSASCSNTGDTSKPFNPNPTVSTPPTLFAPTTFLNVLSKTTIQPYDCNENLRSFLSRDYYGLLILNFFHFNNYLTPYMQNLLVELLLKREIQIFLFKSNFKVGETLEKFEITTARFIVLANEINTTFNEDSAIYFNPSTKTKNGGAIQCGKLWEKYNSEKKLLRTAKILSGEKKTSDSTSTPTIDSKTQDRLTWLSCRICPWEKVIDNWKATCDARKITLTEDKSSLNYFKYPCVRCQRGVELIQIDFKKEYPDQESLFKEKWPKLKSFVKSFAGQKFRNKHNQTETIRKLMNEIKTFEGDHEDAAVLKILTYCIKSTGLKATSNKNKKNKKRKFSNDSSDDESSEELKTSPATFTPKEIEESFIVHVDCAEKIDRELQRKVNEALKKKITLQPYILIVGTPNVELSSYVIVDDIKYATRSVIEAVDLAFKILFVSDSEYSTLSHHIWLFIQIAIYGIGEEKNLGTVIRNMIQSFNQHKV